MSVPRTHDSSCDITVQPTVSTLHIPASHAFIPFQQFSISDGTGLRNPADDNNNKTALPVVSVVTAVSSLCPAVPVVSMQQSAQLAQVVASTIIPTVVTPMTVQTASCLPPTATMTVANTLNLGGHISLPLQQQQQQTIGIPGIAISSQVSGTVINPTNDTFNSSGTNQNTSLQPGNKPSNNSSNNPPPNNSSITSVKSATSKSSNQSSNTEQNEDLVKPVFKDGELVLEVECGQNKAILYLSKLCQGSKGPCISFQSSWLTPNEFQFVSGRETAKDWKRSIRHHGKSLKLLLAKGILNVHPTMCDCDGCRQGATLTRKGEKRRIPNGERKPRKPSSNQNHGGGGGPGDGSSAGAFRPLTNPNMAAQLTSHGGSQAKQAKPEVKRSSGDKTKTTDVTHQSLPKETSAGLSTKQGLCPKSTSVQRPNSLVAATASEQQGISRASSAPSSPIKSPATVSAVAAVATPSAHVHSNLSIISPVSASLTVPPTMSVKTHLSAPPTMSVQSHLSAVPPTIPSQTHLPATLASPLLQPDKSSPPTGLIHQTDSAALPAGLLQIVKMSSAPTTPALAQPFPTAASTSSSPNTPTQSITGHITALSLQSLPATLTFSKQQSEHLASTPNISSARLPCNVSLQPHSVSNVCVPPISSGDPREENKHKSSEEEDDAFTGNESDESQNVDEKSDDIDDESDDEQSDDCSMASENSISSDQMEDAACPDVDAQEASVPEVIEEQAKFDSREDVKEHQDLDTDTSNLNKSTEHANSSEEPAPDQIKEDKQDFLLEPASAVSPSPAVTTTTLTLAGFSSTCSQPLSATISTTNIKSEQIWVPPTLSPSADTHYINRVKHISSSVKHSHDVTENHFRGMDHLSTANKDFDKRNSARKPDRPAQPKSSSSSGVKPDASCPGFSQSRDGHSLHLTQNSHTQRDSVKQDFNESDTKPGTVYQSSNSEKNCRLDDGEERYKQKIKEERNRKEREERNRKDREREERREKERREEKEAERRRIEEKERREYAKVQIEGNSSKEMSAPSNTIDPSRRPPGGVAEAAAFSDYMRVLAAGHGHTFIPPALSYMPSFFPVRSQESSLPNHVHPMTAFGHQISGVPKDPIIYQTPGGVLSNYAASHFGHLHPLLQRSPYTTQQSLLDYQRSLTAVSSYPWPTAYPYFLPDVSATSSSSSAASTSAAATLSVGAKRPTTEMEAALELSAKRMRLEGRPSEYSSPWDYFAAAALASQNQRLASLATSLPCGMESASVDKTWEYLRKRYLEYSPQTAAAYMSALPEYTRPMYYCACADHREDNIRFWNVEDVCKFLNSLEGCSVYADHFREQRVTGRILALLTTDHLVKSLGMKLGPAVLLAEAVAKKLQESSKISNCEACRNMALSLPMHPMAMPL